MIQKGDFNENDCGRKTKTLSYQRSYGGKKLVKVET